MVAVRHFFENSKALWPVQSRGPVFVTVQNFIKIGQMVAQMMHFTFQINL